MVDFSQTIMNGEQSSLKVLKEGSGSLAVTGLGGAGVAYSLATIPHDFASNNLLFQVATTSGYVGGTILPWSSNDGRLQQWASIDANNLYIDVRVEDSGGFGFPGFTLNYSYRILIP